MRKGSPRQRGLADLSGSEQHDDRKTASGSLQVRKGRAVEHVALHFVIQPRKLQAMPSDEGDGRPEVVRRTVLNPDML